MLLAVLLGIVGVTSGVWIVGSTDTGMLCADEFGSSRPKACKVYELPFWLLAAVPVTLVGALTADLLHRKTRPTRG